MPYYVLQDEDWDWDTPSDPGIIVEADTPEEAATKALRNLDCDGIGFKVAEINLIGFIGWDFEHGLDEFVPLKDPSS